MMVDWDDLDEYAQRFIEDEHGAEVILENTGKFFLVVTRGPRWHVDSGTRVNQLCIHSGTVSENTLRQRIKTVRYWNTATPGRWECYITVEARNATQVRNWLTSSGPKRHSTSIERGTMARRSDITARLEVLSREITRLTLEAAKYDNLPDEPGWNDSDYNVILFRKRYTTAGKIYMFAALQIAPNDWVVTGRETRHFTWDELLDFMDSAGTDTDPQMFLSSDWKAYK